MVSFSCETCGDILKKPKLDQHAQRCWAVYTCIDCNVTFRNASEWGKHVSCMSEEQRYHKSVYKAPKGKGQKGQQQQQQSGANATPVNDTPVVSASTPAVAAAAVPEPAKSVEASAPAAAAATTAAPEEAKDKNAKKKKSKKDEKRAREEEDQGVDSGVKTAAAVGGNPAQSEAATVTNESSSEPSQKKSKKDKKAKKTDGGEPLAEVAETTEGKKTADETSSAPAAAESVQSFLGRVVPSLLAESRSLASLKKDVIEKALAEGWKDSAAVEAALLNGVMVGGDKPKKMLRLVFES